MKKHILFSLVAIVLSITNCSKPDNGGKDNPQPPAPSQEQITIPSTVDVSTDMVDLGLSVKWATCNIGASKPEEYGGYYQWAGLEDVTSTDISIGFDENQGIHNCPYHTEGLDYSTGWTKYVQSERFWSGTGSPDHKTVLDPILPIFVKIISIEIQSSRL